MWESLTTKEYHKEAFCSHKTILYLPCGGNDINLYVLKFIKNVDQKGSILLYSNF